VIAFLFDEHVDPALVRGLHREEANLDILEARLALGGEPDEALIERATHEGRVLVTRDLNTLVGTAYARVEAGMPTCGVLVLRQDALLGVLIRDLLLVAQASEAEDWADRVTFVPL